MTEEEGWAKISEKIRKTVEGRFGFFSLQLQYYVFQEIINGKDGAVAGMLRVVTAPSRAIT